MNRLIILMFAIGACAVVDSGSGRTGDVRETQHDNSSSAAAETQAGDTEAAFTCNGSPGQWSGCRGNGCAVCAELVAHAACYFMNHPDCAMNFTCAGQYFTCNDACPPPTQEDIVCCGDGVCNGTETCETCTDDCGPNKGTCGDGTPCCNGICKDGSNCA